MFKFLPARWLAALPALAASMAFAQTAAPADASAEAPAPFAFRSAMEGYRPFADEKAVPWKEANEAVHRRGGWRAYAEEASGGGTGQKANPHAGHAMPMPKAAPAKEKP